MTSGLLCLQMLPNAAPVFFGPGFSMPATVRSRPKRNVHHKLSFEIVGKTCEYRAAPHKPIACLAFRKEIGEPSGRGHYPRGVKGVLRGKRPCIQDSASGSCVSIKASLLSARLLIPHLNRTPPLPHRPSSVLGGLDARGRASGRFHRRLVMFGGMYVRTAG